MHTRVRRYTGLGSFLLTVVLISAACSAPAPALPTVASPAAAPTVAATQAAEGQRGAGDTLKIFLWQAPTIVNPLLSPGTKDLTASRIAYEPLASYDNDGKMVPFLAAEIPSRENGGVAQDGKSVTWKLKPDVKWSDGQPFTAQDVLFTFQYATNPKVASTSRADYEQVKSVEVIDDYTVRVNFKDVNPAWALPFVGPEGCILPQHVFAPYNGANAAEAPANLIPVGTGPYRGVDYRKEDVLLIGQDVVNTVKIIFEPNPYFREANKPYFSRVQVQGGGGDALKAAQAVQTGAVDYVWNLTVSNDVLDKVDAGGKARVTVPSSAFSERIMVNFTDPNKQTADGERSSVQFPHPFLTDLRVRQALAYAVDRDSIAKAYGRTGQITGNLLVSPTNFDSPNTTPYPYAFDLKKATALLDEAGWKMGSDGVREKDGVRLKLTFLTSINPVRQTAQEIVKKNYESIGIQVDNLNVDSSIFLGPPEGTTKTRRQFYADFEEFAFSNKNPDPGAYMSGWTCGEMAQKANNWALSNWGRYCNPDYDKLYKQSTTEMDPEKRRQLIIQMNDILTKDVALIPLVKLGIAYGASNTLTGMNWSAWDTDTWNIKDWARK